MGGIGRCRERPTDQKVLGLLRVETQCPTSFSLGEQKVAIFFVCIHKTPAICKHAHAQASEQLKL